VNGKLAARDGLATGVQAGGILARGMHMPSRPLGLDVARHLSFSGSTYSYGQIARQSQVVLSLEQGPADRRARGVFTMVDRAKNVSIDMKEFGVLQVAKEWRALPDERSCIPTAQRSIMSSLIAGLAGANYHQDITVLDHRFSTGSDLIYRHNMSILPLDDFLIPRMLTGDVSAIRAAGESGDRRFVPALRRRLAA
jgi:hypothetical protein